MECTDRLFEKFDDELEDCYAFKFPIGWETLVTTLLEYIAWHNQVHDTHVKVHSVTKKRGGLHFVILHRPEISSIAEEIFGAIHLAETLSCRTCEACGKPASFVKNLVNDELIMGSFCNEHLSKDTD
jgi:hypothetical protein